MRERSKPSGGASPVWERPEPARRPTPEPLSREGIVQAALELADREGLEGVSLRRVAAVLKAGPMRLYGYMDTKEELLELMVDAVYGEMLREGPFAGGWREVLREVARRLRRASGEHRWFVGLLGGRPQLGPNALGFLEASTMALSKLPGFENIDDILQTLRTVNAYVIGAIHIEASELRAEQSSGLDEKAWQQATGPYIQRLIDSGRFPMLARVVKDATHPPAEREFERGLDCVLDGIASRLAR